MIWNSKWPRTLSFPPLQISFMQISKSVEIWTLHCIFPANPSWFASSQFCQFRIVRPSRLHIHPNSPNYPPSIRTHFNYSILICYRARTVYRTNASKWCWGWQCGLFPVRIPKSRRRESMQIGDHRHNLRRKEKDEGGNTGNVLGRKSDRDGKVKTIRVTPAVAWHVKFGREIWHGFVY